MIRQKMIPKFFDTYFENFDTLEELQISLTEGVIQDRVARDMAEKKKPSQAVEKSLFPSK